MGRKKSRRHAPERGRETAVVAQPPAPSPSPLTPAATTPAPAEAAPVLKKQQPHFGLTIVRWLGALQVAVVLLALFAAVLAVGTVVESWYSDKVAKDLVYR